MLDMEHQRKECPKTFVAATDSGGHLLHVGYNVHCTLPTSAEALVSHLSIQQITDYKGPLAHKLIAELSVTSINEGS